MPNHTLISALNKGRIISIRNGNVELIEKSNTAKLKSIKIKNLPENSIVLSCDGFKTDTFFQKGNGQNMRCDFLIITPIFLHFIELKSDENAETTYKDDCIKKFKASNCISEYIDSVINSFYNQNLNFNNRSKRFMLFYHSTSISKTTTSIKPIQKPVYDTPETFFSWGIQNEAEIDFSLL